MAQGKLKVKTKLPKNVKSNKNKKPKVLSATKRANCPVQPKKTKFEESHRLKRAITKTLNKAFEDEVRARSGETQKTLSKAQEAVANYNKKTEK